MRNRLLPLAAIFLSTAYAQSPAPQFEVAAIEKSSPTFINSMRRGWSNGTYELRCATMLDLIRTAWRIDADKILAGPEWLETDRFDIHAKAPADSTPENLRLMLQQLLKDRFRLSLHADSRDLPAYALTVGKKLQLEHANGSEDTGCRLHSWKPGEPVTLECRNITASAFADQLSATRSAAGYIFNYRVIDRTGLQQSWNFDLKWSLRAPNFKTTPADTVTLFDALEKQLGLKLELSKIATPVLIVDRVNENPTANPPGASEQFPRTPLKFEVAEVKPAGPDDPKGSSVGVKRGGLVNITMTLKGLIQEAWGDYSGALISGGPKSMDGPRFSIVAKAPPTDLASDGAVFNGIDIDSMRLMLRALLVERFGLVAHMEDRLVPGQALVAAKPKLRKADPSHRPGCSEGPGADGKDPRIVNPMASRLVSCRNITIAQFADQLPAISSGYMHDLPKVQDETGISGRYDITLNFSPWNAVPNNAAPGSGGDGIPSEPNGVITLSEALERQLGLKLEPRRVMAPVVVIDRVNENPTEN